MAYTTPPYGVVRSWRHGRSRIVHRRAQMTVAADGTATAHVVVPPSRLVAVQYGQKDADNHLEPQIAATSGALTVKADSADGVQIFTDADLSSVVAVPTPVGTTSLDEGSAATAATDGFSGGFPVRGGAYLSVASGTEGEVIAVDMWFKLQTYVRTVLIAQSGADGSGADNRTIRLGNPGVLTAIAIDYQNTPNTADLTIKADISTGPVLFSRADSNTDLGPTLIGSPGIDEAGAASAATDGTECGRAFKGAIYIAVAQTDAFTQGNEKTIVELWIDD